MRFVAIEYARTEVVHAGPDSSAVGLASYITRSVGENRVTGQTFDFEERSEDLRASGTVLPSRLRDREPEFAHDVAELWSEAERAELIADGTRFRSGAQLAKTQVLALPNELSLEENVELVERWIERTWTDHGAVVTWAIHEPEKGDTNWHAHLLISTRELTEDGFGRKLRELNPTFSRGSYVRGRHDGCDRWREMQNEFFRERGLDAKVDPQRVVARRRFERQFYAEDLHKWREREDRAVRRPDRIIECLTRHQDCFTVRDVDRILVRGNVPQRERERLREEVLGRSLPLADRDGERNGYFTSREARREAEQVRSAARDLAGPARDRKLSNDRVVGAIARVEERAGIRFDFEQDQAIKHACRNRLSVWRGVAGSGKSVALEAVVEAHVRAGYKVIAAAPTNTVAVDLRKTIEDAPVNERHREREERTEGEALTLHSLDWQIGHGRMALDSRTILIVDEAGMVPTGMYAKVLREVEHSGAKLLLVGDDRQLGSIERGGMFRVFVDDLGQEHVRELERVRRQADDWQREATVALASGRFEDAIRAYSEHGSVTFESTLERARDRLIDDFVRDELAEPEVTRFAYAQTNAEVARINEGIQQAFEDSGRLVIEREYETKRRDVPTVTRLGTGDRVQLFGNDKSRGLINGHCGTVTRCEPDRVAMKLDNGKSVEWNPKEFKTFGLGYAGTVYRGQGKTQMQAYSLHTPMADRNTGMVALTRHRDQLKVYAGRNVTPDEKALARQVSRHVERGSSLAYEVHRPGREKEPEVRREPAVKPERPVSPGREHAPPPAARNSAPEPVRRPSAPAIGRPLAKSVEPARAVPPPTRSPGRGGARPPSPEPPRTVGRTGASTRPSPPSPSGRQTPGAPGRTPAPTRDPSGTNAGRTPVPERPRVSMGTPAPSRADLNNMWREKIIQTVQRDFSAEIKASGNGRQREELRGLFAHVRDWVATKADDHFLERRNMDSPKFIVHDVALRDQETARRIDSLPEAYLPMDRELGRIAESLQLSVEYHKPGPQPSREASRQFVEVRLEYEVQRLSKDAADVMARTTWLGKVFTDPVSYERDRIAELKKSLAEIAAERDVMGRYSPLVNRTHDAAISGWEQRCVEYRNQTTMLGKVEEARELPLVERGERAMELVKSFDRANMSREAGQMRDALHERPSFISRPDPEETRERSRGYTMERDRGYDRSR